MGESCSTPLALPQAAMTHWSLAEMTTTWLTPLARSRSRTPGAVYDVMCCSWHVGVKAPGTPTRTTFLDRKSTYRPR